MRMFKQTIDVDPKKTSQEVWDSCAREGRAARACGFQIKHCPPYRDQDMAVSWRMGWRQMDEEMKERRKSDE
jgi:hypothetical protein